MTTKLPDVSTAIQLLAAVQTRKRDFAALFCVPTSVPVNEDQLVVNNLMLHLIQNHRLPQIYCNTKGNHTIRVLAKFIARGWPANKMLWLDSLVFFDYWCDTMNLW